MKRNAVRITPTATSIIPPGLMRHIAAQVFQYAH